MGCPNNYFQGVQLDDLFVPLCLAALTKDASHASDFSKILLANACAIDFNVALCYDPTSNVPCKF
jgi:hypothetical protein